MLGTPSPAVTPTNLLYNVVATPGALYRYRRQHQTGGRLTAVLLIGTVPGVIAGSIIRVLLLPGARVFEVVIAAVLIPLSGWLLLSRQSPTGAGRAGGIRSPGRCWPRSRRPWAVWAASTASGAALSWPPC